MATEILMPALSPTMTEGTLARWLKKEGEAVKAGDVIAEIETDKATMEVEAVDEGVLGRILVADGTAGVRVNAPIAVLIADGETVPAAPAPAVPPAPGPVAVGAAVAPATAPPPAVVAPAAPNGRVFASPLARRIAREANIDLAAIQGSGPQGRIVRADVENAKAASQPAATPPRPDMISGLAPHRAVPNSGMRKTIARRLSQSKSTVPHFYLTIEAEIDALLSLRAELNARSEQQGAAAFKLSVNDLLIKATAVALRRMPKVNASYTEEASLYYDDVDIAVAVAIPDGLITPIVRQADRKSVVAISDEMKDLAARAKAGKLKPEEFQGGGFSISNLGMYGVKQFAAIINPPQGAILAIGAGEKRAVVKKDQLAIATLMNATLAVDHRVIDGALGAEFLALWKGLVEAPLGLLL